MRVENDLYHHETDTLTDS